MFGIGCKSHKSREAGSIQRELPATQPFHTLETGQIAAGSCVLMAQLEGTHFPLKKQTSKVMTKRVHSCSEVDILNTELIGKLRQVLRRAYLGDTLNLENLE